MFGEILPRVGRSGLFSTKEIESDGGNANIAKDCKLC